MVLGGALFATLSGCECSEDAPDRTEPVARARPVEPDAGPPDAGPPDAGRPDAGPPIEIDRRSRFLGEADHVQRRALATEEIAEIEKGRGGRSLAFKMTLRDGTVGYYKPEQSFSAAHWYAEVASYYLDRELGLGRVPPTIGRRMEWAPLREVAAGDSRLPEIVVEEDGTVRGAFIWWVPGGLYPIAPGRGWEKWIRVEEGLAITPYQRPRGWRRDRAGEAPDVDDDEEQASEAGDPDTEDRAAELSDMILFDYLTTNVDRWGGRFTNVRTRGRGGLLVYLDNGAGFTAGPSARIPLMDARLHSLQRFRRSTVDAIRALDRRRLTRRMSRDPLSPILSDRQLDQMEERRAHLLEHVADMERRFGDAAMPW
jgi:hypothetical protein